MITIYFRDKIYCGRDWLHAKNINYRLSGIDVEIVKSDNKTTKIFFPMHVIEKVEER
jgi:hypothetical protein